VSEPCPFCGAKIRPMMVGLNIKQCPVCGNRWIEGGGGGRTHSRDGSDSGGGAAVAVAG